MDYEKKYKEALKRAERFHSEPTGSTERIICEQIFPELKETKDVQIKRAIAHVLNENYADAAVIEGVEIAEITAWLEEQNKKIYANEVIEWLKSYGVEIPTLIKSFEKQFNFDF